QNNINDLGIRDNLVFSNMVSLNVKTGFFGIINFENFSRFNHTAFKTDDSDWMGFSSLHNSFKIYLNPTSRIRFTTDFRYYLPDLSKNNDFLFIDTQLTFTSKNQKISYSLISKNISAKKN